MIDLHLHLDGSLSPALVLELAREQGIPLPCDSVEGVKALLSAPANCESLNEYLTRFDLPIQVLQSAEALERAAYELCCRLADQGLLYAEIRFAPQFHQRKALTQEMAVEAALMGVRAANREKGILAQIILCCMRGAEDEENRETLRVAQRFLGGGVCAADLAGAEAVYPTKQYRDLFRYASDLEVPFTIHAGEADGPQSVRDALSFGARRIGHGVRAAEDPVLVRELAERQIPLELCLTSNLQTKAVAGPKEFPLRQLLQAGVPVTLNTDNMTVSDVTLAGEYRLMESLGLTPAEKEQLLKNAVEAAFLSGEEKAKLLTEVKNRRWPE